MISFLEELMGPVFRQLQLESEEKSGSLLVSKKGKATIHVRKKTTPSKAGGKAGADLSGEALRQAWQQGISPQSKEELYSGRRDSGSVFGGAGRAGGGRAGGTREI